LGHPVKQDVLKGRDRDMPLKADWKACIHGTISSIAWTGNLCSGQT